MVLCIHFLRRMKINFFPEGYSLLYRLYRYVPPHQVGFLRRFGLKTGIHFAHFGLESGMVFEELRERMKVFIVSLQMSKKDGREICEFEMDLKNFFCLHSNLSNDNIVSA